MAETYAEIASIKLVLTILEPMDGAKRDRVLRYVESYLNDHPLIIERKKS